MTVRRNIIGIASAMILAGLFAGPPVMSQAAGIGTRHEDHGSSRHERHRGFLQDRHSTFRQENLISDQPGVATITDPNLVNAWGISHGPNTPVWVSDNGADVTTLYRGAVGGAPVSQVPLVVSIPDGAPTGQVFNDTTDTSAFVVPGTGLPAAFMFIGEHGDLSVWNQAAGTSAVAVAHTDGAIYKGLALVHGSAGPRLLAANFHDNRIDVFDSQFARVSTSGLFQDRFLPRHYAPFNVAEINGQVFVAYARQDADAEDDLAGPGRGFVDVYTNDGAFVRRFATHGVLNSPWGMTIAPSTFGQFAGDVLIGNFGDGRIHAFDPRTGDVQGVLRGASGLPLMIDGLWALVVGDPASGGTDAVWFSAGPDDEQHGLVGVLRAQ